MGLVFASPRSLNLRLEYGGHRPMSEVLDAWPILPISLISAFGPSNKQWDNNVAALESEQSNRICEISILELTNWHDAEAISGADRTLPPTRSVLPALAKLMFRGAYEYLEDLLAQIDAPLLGDLYIEFFTDLIFDVPQLHQFIGHAEEFKKFDRADVLISNHSIRLYIYPNTGSVDGRRRLELGINCAELDHQLLSLAQVCSPSFKFPIIFALEDLQIREDDSLSSSHWTDDMENAQWLEILDPFTSLKNLYLTDGIAQRFCGVLQEVSGERAIEVLPVLRNLFVRGSSLEPVQEAMKPFVAA
ncbi:hypothetical protein BC827DRAFT_826044 [Russula dissimulans]|nr:hypothetical protein BC827DRAFT_826044 [Russula dissimulans]